VFGSGIIELVIGLILIYFLFSLLCSGINEIAEQLLRRRATFLEAEITSLLGPHTKDFLNHPLVGGLKPRSGSPLAPPAPAGWVSRLWKIIGGFIRLPTKGVAKLLGLRGQLAVLNKRATMPSYISNNAFSSVVLSIVGGPKLAGVAGDEEAKVLDAVKAALADPEGFAKANPGLHKTLQALLAGANNSLSEFKKNIETWFDDSMDRLSGWYKRRTKWWLLLWAVLIVGFFNADTILFAKTLWNNNSVRAAVVTQAQQTVQQGTGASVTPCPTPTPNESPYQCVADRVKAVKDLQVPLGWSQRPNGLVAWILKILGLLITAGALTLGAPFWFDLLNKFVNFRATGAPPKPKEVQTK
jgi:hypothetical protein